MAPSTCLRLAAFAALFVMSMHAPADAQATPAPPSAARVIPLWPEGVPNAQPNGGAERIENNRVVNVQVPTLLYRPAPADRANGTAIIICPGGGYHHLTVESEGEGIAGFLHDRGVTTFVLKYRLLEYGHPAPLQDVLRAVRLVRSRAAEFGIRPDRIGVFGGSAGGHVAASAATLYDAPEGRTGAALDAVSGRPDFIGVLYPVITMQGPYAHGGSRDNLLGKHPTQALLDHLSVEKQVTANTPPVFIVHAAEDKTVPVENSVLFYQALRQAGVSVEMHLYERGPHGFGLGLKPGLGPTSEWPARLEDWLRAHGWLPASSTAP